jgi:hypothetical protein
MPISKSTPRRPTNLFGKKVWREPDSFSSVIDSLQYFLQILVNEP